MNKKYSSPNGSSPIANNFNNRNSSPKGESSWPDTTKQQFKSNSPESSRKNQNNKYQNSRNNHQGKFQNKTGQFTSFKTNDSINGGDHAEHQSVADLNQSDSIATVPINQNSINMQQSSFVPSLSPEHSINDSALPSDDSIILNACQDECTTASATTTTLTQSHTNTEMLNIVTSSSSTSDISPLASLPTLINAYASNDSFNKTECCTPNFTGSDNHGITYSSNINSQQHIQTTPQQFSCSPYINEINCTTNGYYEYDYGTNNMMNQSQQASPFYVYHHHQNQHQQLCDYASPNSLGTMASPPQPQQQQQQFGAANGGNYYNYPYMYDPSVAPPAPPPQQSYANNMLYGCSPLTSPQQNQSASLLASYQTPPQSQHHQQLYISTGASSTGESSTAPSTATSASSSNELTSNCNSPQKTVNQQSMYSPPTNPYMVYPPNVYLTPQAYHSPLPTSSSPYVMYSQPPAQSIIGQSFTTPTSINNNFGANRYNNNNNNKQNRFNANNKNSYTNKKNNYQRFNTSTNLDQTPQLMNYSQFLLNSPVSGNGVLPATPSPTTANSANVSSCCDETTNGNSTTEMLNNLNDQSSLGNFSYVAPPPLAQCPPPATTQPLMGNGYEYYDPNTLVQMGINPMTYDYGHSGITTYGEDVYDENYDDNSNLDNEADEQLACYVCRGRRMCFCYFLKVRYYKFPSFFDLVDHQYKKWRQTMIKNKKAAAAQC
jgi:hypothetical protein